MQTNFSPIDVRYLKIDSASFAFFPFVFFVLLNYFTFFAKAKINPSGEVKNTKRKQYNNVCKDEFFCSFFLEGEGGERGKIENQLALTTRTTQRNEKRRKTLMTILFYFGMCDSLWNCDDLFTLQYNYIVTKLRKLHYYY